MHIGLSATTFCSHDKSDTITDGLNGWRKDAGDLELERRSCVGLLNDWIGIDRGSNFIYYCSPRYIYIYIYVYSLHVRMRHWMPRGIANEPTRYFQRIAWHVEEETRARRVKCIFSFLFSFIFSRAKISLLSLSLFFSIPSFFFSSLFDSLAAKLARG